MNFDSAIATGFNAAENAWGNNWTPDGTGLIFTGTFDRLDNRSAPADGGYKPEWDATMVCSVAQFDDVGLTFFNGDAWTGVELGTGQFTLTGGIVDQFLQVGQKIVVSIGGTYRIKGRLTDGYTLDLMLQNPNR